MGREYLIQYIYLDLGFPLESWYLYKIVAQNPVRIMVLILDGSSEIGAHIRKCLLFDLFKAFESSHKSIFMNLRYILARFLFNLNSFFYFIFY